MNRLQQLYQEMIVDHNKNPRGFKVLKDPTHVSHGTILMGMASMTSASRLAMMVATIYMERMTTAMLMFQDQGLRILMGKARAAATSRTEIFRDLQMYIS